jgi:hypothetical protein
MKKLNAHQPITVNWTVGNRPRLRTMMLQAQLIKPTAKPKQPLSGPTKLIRAVVLPLR